ncbi:hypothetical protein Y032_0004g2084 [Ancylostoma ceylanicum]|nr:hypothetical protein Y032_0004g2084 [Ancylostoma ceylanicum]
MFIFEKICFAYWTFTVPFYVFIVCFLIHAQLRNVHDLASPFFKLCISTGIIDIVTLVNNYFGAVFPKWGWFREFYLSLGKPYIYIYFIIAWATGINQSLSVSLLATNRLSAILFPQQFQKVASPEKITYIYFSFSCENPLNFGTRQVLGYSENLAPTFIFFYLELPGLKWEFFGNAM